MPTHIETPHEVTDEQTSSLIKLQGLLSFLMTEFYRESCPKIALYIVRHLYMMIEHAALDGQVEIKELYLQLQQEWQHIAAAALQRPVKSGVKNTH